MVAISIEPTLAARSYTTQSEHPVSQTLTRVASAHPALTTIPHEHLSPIMDGHKHQVSSELTHAKSIVPASTTHVRPSPIAPQSALPDIIATIDMTADLHHQLRDKLKQIFKSQPISNPTKCRKLDYLIEHKVNLLIGQKITADELERRLSNAERVDQITAVLQGFASATSFATASVSTSIYAHAMAYPSDTKHAAIIGAMVGTINTVLSPVINASCRVAYYTKATSEQLEPAMHQHVPLHQRDTYSETSVTMTSLTIPYTCRNIVAGSINSAAAYFSGAALPFTSNLLCENLLALPAGVASNCFNHYREKQDGLSGRAYFLARTDWLALLEELKHGVMTMQRTRNLLSHSVNGCIVGLKALPNATLKLISASGLAEVTILAAGLALSNYMQSLMPTAATPFETEANKQIMNTICMSNVYAIFSSVVAVAGRHGWHVNWSRIWQALVSVQESLAALKDLAIRKTKGSDSNNNALQLASLSNGIYTLTAESQLSPL